jgi:hypothetical protein
VKSFDRAFGQRADSGMSSVAAPKRTFGDHSIAGCLSWRAIAADIRRRLGNQPQADDDLLKFAELLDAFAKIEDMRLEGGA